MLKIPQAVGLSAALLITITLTITLAGCGGGSGTETLDTGDFLLTATTGVEGFGELMVSVRSDQPGHCYFSTGQDRSGMIGLTFNADGTIAERTDHSAVDPEHKPVALTGSGGVISRYRKFDSSPQALVYTDENGADTILVRDITKASGMGAIPSFHYAPGGALTMFLYDDAKTVYLKQAARLEGEHTTLGGVICRGTGFLDGERTQLYLTEDGTAFRFDPATTTFVEVPEMAWLGFLKDQPEIADNTGKRPKKFTFTRDMAAIRLSEVLLLHTRDGASLALNLHGTDCDSYADDRRADRAALADGPKGITMGCMPVPLDDDRILLMDMFINKMIVVAPSPGE